MTKSEKKIEKAQADAEKLSQKFGGVPVVWMGGNNYIVIKDGFEIRVTLS